MLVLLAIALRALAALNVRVIDSDGARNLQMAALIQQGRFAEALRVPTPTPPLHPFLTVLVDVPIGNLLGSGVLVSVLLGGLSVLPLYAMAKRTWDDGIGIAAGLLYALLPAIVDVHAEPMTEATFMFFFLGAMALGWRAIEERSWELTIVTAGSAALAWLARPEGIYLLPLFALAALLRFSRFSLPAVALFVAVAAVLAFPYLCYIRGETGHWQLSLSPIPGLYRDYWAGTKHPELALQDYSEYRVVGRYGALLGGSGHLLANLFGKVLFYILGPFLILGLFRPRPAAGGRALLAYQWTAAAGYLVPILLSFFVSTPFSHRFLLIPAALLLPTIAAGYRRAAEGIGRPVPLGLVVVAFFIVMAVRDLRPRRADKEGYKEAGLAILKSLGPGRRVHTNARAVEYYARAEHGDPAKADAYAFCVPELRGEDRALERRLAAEAVLLGEYPSTPRKGVMPVRVYVPRSP